MKVIYEFDPYEDKDSIKTFQRAEQYSSAIYEATLAIRNFHKYSENDEGPECDPLELQVKKLYELLKTIEDEFQGMGYWED